MKKPIAEMLTEDGENAGYRVAANTITKVVRGGLIAALENSDSGIADMGKEALGTEAGKAIVGYALGAGLTFAPGGIGSDPRVAKVASEFRVEAMVDGGQAFLQQVGESILPALTEVISGLPLGSLADKVTGGKAEKFRVHHAEEDDELPAERKPVLKV